MELEFNLPVSAGIIVGIIAVGLVGMWQGNMMTENTLFMMVLPSMVIFAGVMFAIGVKHGEYRASNV
jgi:ABC-type dipeptide/oligopeptide/nickel transport system permease subunit